MDSFFALGHGFLVALEPSNLLFATVGVLLGTLVGVLPGIGPALTVALLLPVTFKLDPGGSIIMFAGRVVVSGRPHPTVARDHQLQREGTAYPSGVVVSGSADSTVRSPLGNDGRLG